jgi:hypothetical protein
METADFIVVAGEIIPLDPGAQSLESTGAGTASPVSILRFELTESGVPYESTRIGF